MYPRELDFSLADRGRAPILLGLFRRLVENLDLDVPEQPEPYCTDRLCRRGGREGPHLVLPVFSFHSQRRSTGPNVGEREREKSIVLLGELA